jgi:hypothetical protein
VEFVASEIAENVFGFPCPATRLSQKFQIACVVETLPHHILPIYQSSALVHIPEPILAKAHISEYEGGFNPIF